MAAVGRWRPPWSIDATIRLPLLLFRILRRWNSSNWVSCRGQSRFFYFRHLIPTFAQYAHFCPTQKKLFYGFRLSAETFGDP